MQVYLHEVGRFHSSFFIFFFKLRIKIYSFYIFLVGTLMLTSCHGSILIRRRSTLGYVLHNAIVAIKSSTIVYQKL